MFATDFIINCNKNSDTGYTLVIDAAYLEYLYPLHRDLSLLLGKILSDGVPKLVAIFKIIKHKI